MDTKKGAGNTDVLPAITKNMEKIVLDYMNRPKMFCDEKFENSFVNIIRRDYEKKASNNYEKINPLWVGFKVTGRCNFQCEHCWATLYGEERPFKEIIKVIDKMKKMGISHITVSGGEPFIRKLPVYFK